MGKAPDGGNSEEESEYSAFFDQENEAENPGGDRITFRKLAESYRKRLLIPPEYHKTRVGLRKVAGLRSYQSVGHYIDTLVAHFGCRRIRDVTHADIEDLNHQRLKTLIRRGERRIAGVNRTIAQIVGSPSLLSRDSQLVAERDWNETLMICKHGIGTTFVTVRSPRINYPISPT